jgi:hypothetical protein
MFNQTSVGDSCAIGAAYAPERMLHEQQYASSLNAKLQMVRDFTASVVQRRTTGFYLYGPGGYSKSYTILRELERQEPAYRMYNGHMTGRALFDALAASPDEIHVLEDLSQLCRDTRARGVLLSALWSNSPANPQSTGNGLPDRSVAWSTNKGRESFVFRGGLIMTANRALSTLPELSAIETRISHMQLIFNDNEMWSLMRSVANHGFWEGRNQMDPEECREVCEFVIDKCKSLNRRPDMRLMIHGFRDYLQDRDCDSLSNWREIVLARINQRPTELATIVTPSARDDQKQREQAIAAEIVKQHASPEQRYQAWRDQTGKSKAAFYRRLEELKPLNAV